MFKNTNVNRIKNQSNSSQFFRLSCLSCLFVEFYFQEIDTTFEIADALKRQRVVSVFQGSGNKFVNQLVRKQNLNCWPVLRIWVSLAITFKILAYFDPVSLCIKQVFIIKLLSIRQWVFPMQVMNKSTSNWLLQRLFLSLSSQGALRCGVGFFPPLTVVWWRCEVKKILGIPLPVGHSLGLY